MSVRANSDPGNEFRFPRHQRLLKPEAFARVFREGQRSSDRFFTLLAAANGLDHPRLGLTVSRKAAASAVIRNRVKRQARESFRLHQADLPAVDIVVMAKRDAAGAESRQLRDSLEQHWRKLAKQCDAS